MTQFALNHMTVARLSFARLLDLAADLGMAGIELRNDLPQALLDGMEPAAAGALIRQKGLRLLALAEVKRFNDWSPARAAEALALAKIAKDAGAEAISLIPRNDNLGMAEPERTEALVAALSGLKPILEDHGLIGMVEPLGFPICALRYKSWAVEGIEAVGGRGRFKLVHDTFHHTLAGGGPLFPEHTGIVHISGVEDPEPAVEAMQDTHRVLVGEKDRLGNLEQLRALKAAGWDGPVSYEAFAPQTHALADPKAALRASMDFIAREL